MRVREDNMITPVQLGSSLSCRGLGFIFAKVIVPP